MGCILYEGSGGRTDKALVWQTRGRVFEMSLRQLFESGEFARIRTVDWGFPKYEGKVQHGFVISFISKNANSKIKRLRNW